MEPPEPADPGQTGRGPRRGRTPLFDNRSRWLDRYGLLLTLTAVTIALSSLVDPSEFVSDVPEEALDLMAIYVGLATLLLAFAASGLSHRRLVGMAVVLGILAALQTLLAALALLGFTERGTVAVPVGPFLLTATAFAVIVRRLARHRRIDRATLLGAVTAYLFIPLTFFYLFRIVDVVGGEHFFGRPESAPTFMFFSLTTVTTLGYGVPRPETNLAQLLSASEAIIGQLFLVTVVALIVGLMASTWRGNRATDDEPAGTSEDTVSPGSE